MRQTAALAEAARQNLAETAWQVRRRVRAGLLADLAASRVRRNHQTSSAGAG